MGNGYYRGGWPVINHDDDDDGWQIFDCIKLTFKLNIKLTIVVVVEFLNISKKQ